MKPRVRLATLDDVRGIVDVHCSDVKRWYKRVGGRRAEARYEDLSVEERFEHGGPWMSVETCAVHLNYVLVSGQHPLVAELEGKIIGELELYVGEECGRLGKTAFIDVLEVHRDYRRRGVGRALVEGARRIAVEEGCETLSVWPEERAVGFYRKCGLGEEVYGIVHVVVDTASAKEPEGAMRAVERELTSYDDLANKLFVTPRMFSSFAAWLKSRWSIALESRALKPYEGVVPELDAAFIIDPIRLREREARLSLWVRDAGQAPEALALLCWEARRMRTAKLHIVAERSILEEAMKRGLPMRVVSEEVVLAERLS